MMKTFYLSQRAQSLKEKLLWIGEKPIQRRAFGLNLLLKELGQKFHASIL